MMKISESFLKNLKGKKKYLLFSMMINLIFLFYIVNSQSSFVERMDASKSEPIGPITHDADIKQEFTACCNNLHFIEIQFATYARQNDSNIIVSLIEKETDTIIFEELTDCKEIVDNQYRKFSFSPVAHSKNNKFVINITSDSQEENAITAWSNNNFSEQTKLYINDVLASKNLNFKIGYSETGGIKSILFAIAVVLSLLSIFFITENVVRNFVLLSAIFGVYFAIINPFYHPIDEISHFYRAYDVSQGNIFLTVEDGSIGSYLPKDIKNFVIQENFDELIRNRQITVNPKEKEFTNEYIKYTNPYCFISYIPSAIGIVIGRLFTQNMIPIILLSRITNLIFYIIIVSISIKIIPLGKNILMIIALTPFQLLMSSSITLDGILLGSIFLFISICFRFIYSEEMKIQYRDIVMLTAIGILIAGTKSIPYMPMILLFFSIPLVKFQNKKQYWVSLGIGIFSVALFLLSMKIFSPQLVFSDDRIAGTNLDDQLYYILQNPLMFLFTVLNTFHNNFIYYIFGSQPSLFFGNNISNIILPLYLFWLSKIDCDFKSLNKDNFTKKHTCLFAFIIVICFILINLSLYISFSPVGSQIVHGLQGRYYLPLFALLLLSVNKFELPVADKDKIVFNASGIAHFMLNYSMLLFINTLY